MRYSRKRAKFCQTIAKKNWQLPYPTVATFGRPSSGTCPRASPAGSSRRATAAARRRSSAGLEREGVCKDLKVWVWCGAEVNTSCRSQTRDQLTMSTHNFLRQTDMEHGQTTSGVLLIIRWTGVVVSFLRECSYLWVTCIVLTSSFLPSKTFLPRLVRSSYVLVS